MGEDELIGVRDPFGFRPLCLGRLRTNIKEDGVDGTAYVLASETCALDLIHAEFVRDIAPGEIVVIDQNGVRSVNPWEGMSAAACLVHFRVRLFRPARQRD